MGSILAPGLCAVLSIDGIFFLRVAIGRGEGFGVLPSLDVEGIGDVCGELLIEYGYEA